MNTGILCESCSATMEKKVVTKRHRLMGKLHIVENVEAEVCIRCGQTYFAAKTLDAIDTRLQRGRA